MTHSDGFRQPAGQTEFLVSSSQVVADRNALAIAALQFPFSPCLKFSRPDFFHESVDAVCPRCVFPQYFSLLLDSFGVVGFYKGQEKNLVWWRRTTFLWLSVCSFFLQFLCLDRVFCGTWFWNFFFRYPFAYFGCHAFVAFESVRDSIISIERFR